MYVERKLSSLFDKLEGKYGILAIVGPRQAGKTTFLKERLHLYEGNYVSLDDPDARDLFDEDIKKFENQYIRNNLLLVIDEVQYGKDAGTKLKYLADKGRKLWITSSSQILLGNDVLSWLVGRVSILKLYPFSLSEFLEAKQQKEITDKILNRIIMEQVAYGSYPKVVLEEDYEIKEILLKDLRETIILKDVARAFSIQDISVLEAFSKYLSHSIGNVFIYENVSSDLKISFQTVKKYLEAMEKSYIITLIQPFYTNKLKEITKQPKIYFVDTGIRNSLANNFPKTLENEGKLFENYVFNEMSKAGIEAKYWQTKSKAEVDFVIEKAGAIIPIEVKVKASDKIERSLRSFIDSYKPKKAIVVFYEGAKRKMLVGNCSVIFTDVAGLIKLIT